MTPLERYAFIRALGHLAADLARDLVDADIQHAWRQLRQAGNLELELPLLSDDELAALRDAASLPATAKPADPITERVRALVRVHVLAARDASSRIVTLLRLDPELRHSTAFFDLRETRDREIDYARIARRVLTGERTPVEARRLAADLAAVRRSPASAPRECPPPHPPRPARGPVPAPHPPTVPPKIERHAATAAAVARLRTLAGHYRAEHANRFSGGYIIIYDGRAYGWTCALEQPADFIAGNYAVPLGHDPIFRASGRRTDHDGATAWTPVEIIP